MGHVALRRVTCYYIKTRDYSTGKVIEQLRTSRGDTAVKVQFNDDSIADQIVPVVRYSCVYVRIPPGVARTADTNRPP